MDRTLKVERINALRSKGISLDDPPARVIIHTAFKIERLNAFYGEKHVLKEVDLDIPAKSVTAIIGPSGCGKSTFIRCLNRMNDLIHEFRVAGKIMFNGIDINSKGVDVVDIRRQIGMVFQKPNPFPKSVYENVVYGLRIQGIKNRKVLDSVVEESLKKAAIWDEVKDRLYDSALSLSGGQQQRLCIARMLAVKPEVLLMDEPCSALDPTATAKIEELIGDLKSSYTVVLVTHNMQQAARVSDNTAFLLHGELIEYDLTERIFTNPKEKVTEDYITGRFG